jgi:hypothetical protein
VELGDSDSLIETAFSNVPGRDRAHAYWAIIRGWNDSKENPPEDMIRRLVEFWEWRVTALESSNPTDAVVEEAKGLGWFLRTPYIPKPEVARLGVRTARLAKGDLQLHTDWEYLVELAEHDIDAAYSIAEMVLLYQFAGTYPYVHVTEVKPFLGAVLKKGSEDSVRRATALIHRLGERGYVQFGELLRG